MVTAPESPDAIRARNQTRREATRMRIIQGAARALAKTGIDAASVQTILDAAGVSRRTYYQFFADKEAVLVAIFERWVEHFIRRQQLAMDGEGSGIERVLRGQAVYLDFASMSGVLVRELIREAQRPGGPLLAARQTMHENLQALLCETWQQAEGGELDPLLARSLVLFNEALTVHVLTQSQSSVQEIGRARRLLGETTRRLLQDPPL